MALRTQIGHLKVNSESSQRTLASSRAVSSPAVTTVVNEKDKRDKGKEEEEQPQKQQLLHSPTASPSTAASTSSSSLTSSSSSSAPQQQPLSPRKDSVETRGKAMTLGQALQPRTIGSDLPKRDGLLTLLSGTGVLQRKPRKMWAQTSGRFLYLYKERGASPPQIALPLRGARVRSYNEGALSFELQAEDEKPIVLKAETKDDYNQWMYVLSVLTGQ